MPLQDAGQYLSMCNLQIHLEAKGLFLGGIKQWKLPLFSCQVHFRTEKEFQGEKKQMSEKSFLCLGREIGILAASPNYILIKSVVTVLLHSWNCAWTTERERERENVDAKKVVALAMVTMQKTLQFLLACLKCAILNRMLMVLLILINVASCKIAQLLFLYECFILFS